MNFIIIKTKPFVAKGVEHTHYSVAHKGRVFGVSTLRFDASDLIVSEDGKSIAVSGEIEVIKSTSTDPFTGKTGVFLDIVPKMNLELATF